MEVLLQNTYKKNAKMIIWNNLLLTHCVIRIVLDYA